MLPTRVRTPDPLPHLADLVSYLAEPVAL